MNWFTLYKPKGERQPHPHIKSTDICFYAREYKAGDKTSKPNQLIYDFKSRPRRSFPRKEAIEQFSKEVAELFKPDGINTIIAMPSSKIKTDREYDNRFEDLFKEILKTRPYLKIEEPVENKKTIQDTRNDGSRDPDVIKENYIWKGWGGDSPERVFIIDDVLTTGAHFRAISDFLKDNGYRGKVVGLFWAKTDNPKYNK